MALPCRISVWEEDDQVKIGTLNPTELLSVLSDAEELKPIAEEVENTIKKLLTRQSKAPNIRFHKGPLVPRVL